ncbi:MAG: sigma-70 family RNA polymerase sigma factor [Candidatus Kapabacteria bacterium]|jgi:RNA polymerase sigma-70 factor (ECF subfamily)|nr:sigma-70 family RNA polymerase sigma factor [Candidatus Kapabacteria bacterium]
MTPNDHLQQEFESEALPHMSALFNFAVRLCRDRDDAADLVQETYLKAYRFFDKFERGTNCKAWLFRILKNSYINRYRKNSKEPDVVDYDTVEDFYEVVRDNSVVVPGSEEQVFSEALDDEVAKAIDGLPEEFRTVIILCDIEEFTYEEIADFVDCPIGTVRSRLHRARKMLAATLYEYATKRGYGTGSETNHRIDATGEQGGDLP